MALVRVAVLGTVGKGVLIDDTVPSRVSALETAVRALTTTGGARHSSLSGLQVGDDHPQYTMWQTPEQIAAKWNFAAEPNIESVPLTEFIQDTVGMDLVEDTNSITWTYTDAAGTLEADVVPEFVEDTVGAMLTDTASIDLVYDDVAGQITANIIDEYVQDLVGAMLDDSDSVTLTYDDATGTIVAEVVESEIEELAVGALAAFTLLTQANETASLPASRRLVAGANVSFNIGTPGQLIISSSGGGGGGGGGYPPALGYAGW